MVALTKAVTDDPTRIDIGLVSFNPSMFLFDDLMCGPNGTTKDTDSVN